MVWKKSIELCEKLYKHTDKFPQSEIYGLTSQIKSCSVAIPSNIDEGQRRGTLKVYNHFLRISYGSGAELETQLIIVNKIGYISNKVFEELSNNLDEIMKMLNKLISVLIKK